MLESHIFDARVVIPEPKERVTLELSLYAAGVLLAVSSAVGGPTSGPRGMMDQLNLKLRTLRRADGTRIPATVVTIVDHHDKPVTVYLHGERTD